LHKVFKNIDVVADKWLLWAKTGDKGATAYEFAGKFDAPAKASATAADGISGNICAGVSYLTTGDKTCKVLKKMDDNSLTEVVADDALTVADTQCYKRNGFKLAGDAHA